MLIVFSLAQSESRSLAARVLSILTIPKDNWNLVKG